MSKVRSNRGIKPRKRAKLGGVIGVGQAPHVKNKVRSVRKATLITERFKGEREFGSRLFDKLLHPTTKLRGQ